MYILIFLLWIALNGKITLEIILFGLVISMGIYWFMCNCLEYSPSTDLKMCKNFLKGIHYLWVLFTEIIKSNIVVLKFLLSKDVDIQPQIIFFKSPLKNEFLQTLLANSITLTPGTITVHIEGDVFCVHALDYSLAEDFSNSIFVKLLKEMEDNL